MNFSFAQPWLLTLLLLVPVLTTLPYWARRSSRSAGLRYSSTQLTASSARSWRLMLRSTPTVLRMLALSLIVIAVARPQTSEAREIVRGEGVDIALALDISGSMSALDFSPLNRLEAAKEVITDFIAERHYDRIGLVIFASESFIQSPPTIDHHVLELLLDDVELASSLRIEDGTAIGLGLASAANIIKDSKSKSKVIILLTDGVNNTGEIDPQTAAMAAQALGIKVYTIGAGRPGLVRLPQRDHFGQLITVQESQLDEETLRQIADTTGGRYYRATDAEGLRQIYDEINSLEKSTAEVRIFTRYQELAGWALAPALVMLLAELMLRNTVFRKIP